MPFKPGNKLGKGRPPSGRAFSDMLRVAVSERGQDGKQKLRILAEVLLEKALAGDILAIREVADRLEGKPIANVTNDGSSGLELVISLSDADLKLM